MISPEEAAELEEELRGRRTPRQWRILGWTWAVFIVACSATPIVLTLALGDRLPDRVATRGAFTGEPTSSMSQQVNMFGLSAATLFGLVVVAVVFAPRLARISTSAKVPPLGLWGAFLAGMGGLMVGCAVGIVRANLDVATWQDARLGANVLLFIVVGTVVGAVLGWWVDRALSDPDYRQRRRDTLS